MKASTVLVVFLLLAFMAFPASAFNGHLATEYDFLSEKWAWEMGIKRDLFDWLTVGATQKTLLSGYTTKTVIPSGVPEMQSYILYVEAKIPVKIPGGDESQMVRLRLDDWCDHYLSQSGIGWQEDKSGLTLSLRLDF